MKNIISKSLILVLIAFLFLMTGCVIIDNNLANDDIIKPEISKNKEKPTGNYNKDKILVKYGEELTNDLLGSLEYLSFERLYKGSKWYLINLKETIEATDAYSYLNDLNIFEAIDYDYIMQTDGEVLSTDISSNTYAEDLSYLETLGVKKGWEHNANNKKYPGGTSDVVIAIIDTGVDYNHLDLIDNIWVNTAEIPNNGIDDDNNGYIDDINGWNCVGDNNDPMDDNGHGTHVAGIAAASNNKMGTVGIAYNCKIMCLKAGSSSGYFSSSDIAEAVEYAYMNGASVINMSFGGTEISRFTKEALENAYNQCVLVAAAGNSGMCNQPNCPQCFPNCAPFYPASLTYVIGVMSCDSTGQYMSGFSNYDHYLFNEYEYDIYSCGENIVSTWPNNKYASLSGTSMASPTVAGIAAVLRSTFSDRELYSNKFITSQIVRSHNTNEYGVANLYNALTNIPKPFVYGINDCYIFDNVEFSDKNNGNGVIDAGETIRLAVELINRGGVATNVVATIDTIRNDDASITDKYFTITKDTVEISDIGTYSTRDFGKIYDSNGNLIGTEKYFEFIVSEDCPNSYLSDFNLNLSYNNGLDEKDKETYNGICTLSCMVNRGYHLPSIITEDTTFTNNTLYIVSNDVIIPEGVTVNFEEGCQIQFYDNREYFNSPRIKVYGELNFNGSKENMIDIFPENLIHENFICFIDNYSGIINYNYTEVINLSCEQSAANQYPTFYNLDIYSSNFVNSSLKNQGNENGSLGQYVYGLVSYANPNVYNIFKSVKNSYFELANGSTTEICYLVGSYINDLGNGNIYVYDGIDNIFYREFPINGGINDKSFWFFCNTLENNKFMLPCKYEVTDLPNIRLRYNSHNSFCICKNNDFSNGYKDYISSIINDYMDEQGNPRFDINDTCSDVSKIYPHILKYEIFDKDGNIVNKIGTEEVTFRITFNQDMDTTKDAKVYFGSVAPYSDYEVEGKFISPTVWEGKYELKAYIENGLNYLHVENACAASDPTLKVYGDYQLHEFDIDTTTALSMNIQAKPTDTGIELNWIQDDYDTLMGYNVYRSEEKDGNYVRINPYIIPGDELTFFDDNAEPGKTYWYTFTVVLSDFTESNPAGKIVTTAKDTIVPNVYHTPVNQGYLNNNLVISCTASDNVAIAKVMLYYRTKGAESWKSLQMLKQNDKYSATVFGSELSIEGLEYYIIAYDSQNAINKGTEENPYSVIIKDALSIIRLGDVDGDGTLTTKDALMIIKAINGDLLLTDDEFKRADLNKDNVLSSVEALRILQFINGNVNSLEME